MTRSGAHPLWLLGPPAIFLAGFLVIPLGAILVSAWGADEAWSWLATPYVRQRLAVATLQAVLSVLLTLAVAIPLAYLHHKYRIPFRRAHLAIHAAPFVLPVFVVVYGIQGILGPRGWLSDVVGVDILASFGPLAAVVIAHVYYNYGFAARVLTTVLDRRPWRLEEAARTLGATKRAAFLRASLPALLPSAAGVALLVFLFSFASFGTVLFLGGGEVSTLETLLYQNLGGAFPREDRAAVLGVVQLGINLALFAAYGALRRRETGGVPRDARVRRARPKRVHQALALALLFAAVLPAASVLVGGFRVGGEWSFEGWRALLDPDHPAHLAGFRLETAILWSFAYATIAVGLSVVLTLLLAYGSRPLGQRARSAAEGLASVPLGTSSLLVGLGFLLVFGAGALLDLRGSPLLVAAAHTLVAFPFTARILLPAIALHERRLDDAAASLGAPFKDIVTRVHLPVLRAPMLVAAGLAAAMSLGDFGASVLLMRSDTMGLSVWIARHDAPFNPLLKAQAVALAGVLTLLAGTAYLIVERAGAGSFEDL